MRKFILLFATIAATLSWAATFRAASAATAAAPEVAFPTGYRAWRHVKSMIIEPGHPLSGLVEGTHHLYANAKALQGYRKRPFADGSVIVFDLLKTERGDKAITEGGRKAVIVMQKDSKRFASTGGWGFEVFAEGRSDARKVGNAAHDTCFTCHTSERSRDFVFSEYRD